MNMLFIKRNCTTAATIKSRCDIVSIGISITILKITDVPYEFIVAREPRLSKT